ncbi:hypothetical protein pb186bvf_019635 [Paramecium bursaria]
MNKLENAINNVRFLEQKIGPLSEDNQLLKSSIHALIYYMEERRRDFASLLQSKTPEREILIKIGDLNQVYEGLKEDINDLYLGLRDKDNFINSLHIQIKEQEQSFVTERETFKDKIKLLHEDKDNLRQAIQQNDLFVQTLREQHYREIQQKELEKDQVQAQNQQHIRILQNEHQKVLESIKMHDEDQDKKLNEIKAEFQLQKDKMELQQLSEIQYVRQELQDKINQLDVRNRQNLTELQNSKQDQLVLNQNLTSAQKQINKYKKQLENQFNLTKQLKDEIIQLRIQKDDLLKQQDLLKIELDRQTKQHHEVQKRYQKSREQIDYLENEKISEQTKKQYEQKQLEQQIQGRNAQIQKLKEEMLNIQQYYQRQNIVQRVKYEKMIDSTRVVEENLLEFVMIDKETQFDDPVTKEKLAKLEQLTTELEAQLFNQKVLYDQQAIKFAQQQNQLKQQMELKVVRIMQDFEKQLKQESEKHKYQVEQLIILKQNDLAKKDLEHSQDRTSLIFHYENDIDKLKQQIKQLNEYLLHEKEQVAICNNTIVELQENLIIQRLDNEKDLKKQEENNQIQILQLQQIYNIKQQELNGTIQKLQQEIEDNKKNQTADQKVIGEMRKRIETLNGQVQATKEENRQLNSMLDNKEEVIDQSNSQLSRQNEVIKYLQIELENTKQVYNIFKNSSSIQPNKIQIPDEYPIKGELKKILQYRVPSKDTNRQKYTRSKRPLYSNISINLAQTVHQERSLPKIRSTSKNEDTRSSPRLFQ